MDRCVPSTINNLCYKADKSKRTFNRHHKNKKARLSYPAISGTPTLSKVADNDMIGSGFDALLVFRIPKLSTDAFYYKPNIICKKLKSYFV